MPVLHGYTADADAALETIMDGVAGAWVPPTQARVHAVVSGSVNDASAGTGARTVQVTGYNSSRALVSETVTLNGTTPVNTSNSFSHITEMRVLTVGSGGVSAGIITATAATDSTVTSSIPIAHATSMVPVLYPIEFGKQYRITSVWGSAGNAATGDFTVYLGLRKAGETLWRRLPVFSLLDAGTTTFLVPYDLVVSTGDIVRLDVLSSAANQVFLGSFSYTELA